MPPLARRRRSGPDATALLALAGLALTTAEASGADLSWGGVKRGIREAIAADPFDATVQTVLGGAFLFWMAERDVNPKVRTYWDALVFVSTCLSVGYADIFARTPAGQAIASALMTIGPALSGAMLDVPAEEARKEAEKAEKVQLLLAEKLDAILQELRAGRAA